MSQTVEIHYQALVDAIGMENTTQLIHGHAGLGFYTYLNFQIDEMLDDDPSMSPTIEQIFDLLKEYPEEDEKIVEIKKLTSLEQVLTHIEERMSILDKSNWELLDRSEDNLNLLKQLMSSKLTNTLEDWKDSLTR